MSLLIDSQKFYKYYNCFGVLDYNNLISWRRAYFLLVLLHPMVGLSSNIW